MSSMSMPASDTASDSSRSKNVCSVCRNRKVACDRQRPRCSLCQKHNFDCEYVSRERKPGLRAGYVSQLEQCLVDLESRVRHLEINRSSPTYMDVGGNGPSPSSAAAVRNGSQGFSELDTPAALSPSNVSAPGPIVSIPSVPSVESATQADIQALDFGSLHSQSNQQTPENVNTDTSNSLLTAPTILNPLSFAVVTKLVGIWFEKYHTWFPILHQPSLLDSLQMSPSVESSSHYLVIKAIVAVTFTYCQSCPSTQGDRQKCSESLRDSVTIEALNYLSLQSIQSLLILSNMEYGAGRTGPFGNMIALCKRMSLQLGLQDLVTNQGEHLKNIATVPPRKTPLPSTAIDREECIRAYWMTEMLDSMSILGSSRNIVLTTITPESVLPCSDSLWAFPEHIINVWSFGEFKYSSAFSICNILVASELGAVHSFLRKSFDLSIPDQRNEWQREAQQLDERLTSWREEFVAAVFRLINAEFAQEERAEMDPNIVLTNCLLNTAVIVLFERQAPYPEGIDRDYNQWAYATNRCVYACENMAAKIRRINNDELRIGNPHLIFSIFVAARFYIVYSKALDANIPTDLYSLAYALHLCSERWELARIYETVLRTAVAEHKTSVSMSSLPLQFFDLRYSASDLESMLSSWYANLLPAISRFAPPAPPGEGWEQRR